MFKIIIFALSMLFVAGCSNSSNFYWSSKDNNKTCQNSITFNSTTLGFKKLLHPITLEQISLFKNKKYLETVSENDHVCIITAFPNTISSNFAIISEGCNGSLCGYSKYYLLTFSSKNVSKYYLGKKYIRFSGELKDNELITGSIETLSPEMDIYGSEQNAKLIYLKNKALIDPKMKDYYKNLISDYNFTYFENPNLRKTLVDLVGHEKFQKIRLFMGVSSLTQLIDYKYLFLQGCQPHACGENQAAIIIDSTNENTWWALKEGVDLSSGSNTKIDGAHLRGYRNAFRKFNVFDGYITLSFNSDGNLIFIPYESSSDFASGSEDAQLNYLIK